MRVERHKLEPGEWLHARNDGELFVHPLVGYAQVNGKPIGGRKNIFHPFPGGELLEKDAEIKAVTAFDVIVATCATKHVADTATVEAKIHRIGHGTAKREVREILGFGGPAQHLRCGETVNRPGGWSSWPPHAFDRSPTQSLGSFDKDATTMSFQECFYVFTDPRDSYALIARKGGGYDDVVKAFSGTRVDVPLGEHPIVAAPGTKLIYAWFYVGADKHYAQWAEDLGGYK